MAKNTLPAKASEPTAAAKEYRIKPGVEWVNGQRVKGEKTVRLTDAEAAHSFASGHISPADKPEPAEWSKKAEVKPDDVRD